jgi:hypothetical protein
VPSLAVLDLPGIALARHDHHGFPILPAGMNTIVFRCRACGLPLTHPLEQLDDLSRLCLDDGEAMIPRGEFSVEQGDYYTLAVGHYLVNLGDLLNVKHHADARRLNGCCGLDGCGGRNLVCVNGHEIGTEHSDCWQAHAAQLDPAVVVAVEAVPA